MPIFDPTSIKQLVWRNKASVKSSDDRSPINNVGLPNSRVSSEEDILTRKFLRIPRFVLRLAGRSLHRVAKALRRRSTSPFRNDGGSKAPVLIIAALDGTEITYCARILAFTLTDPSGDQRDPVVCWGRRRGRHAVS
jgi:hypothetical protein